MPDGQGVLTSALDVAALNRVDSRLQMREATRCQVHAQLLRDVLDVHRFFRDAGHELNTVPHASLVLGCSEHRAHELLEDALLLASLPGALEAVECGLLAPEHARKLIDALTPLAFPQRLAVWRRLQALLIDTDTALAPARLAERLREWVIQADPAGATERRKQAEARGSVDYRTRAEDGLTDIHLSGLNGPNAHGCLHNIRRHAEPWGPDDERSADKRRLDAACDLLMGRMPLAFGEEQHCQPGCDCRPLQPAPCGADVTVLVPLGAALRTTDELAHLVGHGPLEPDLLHDLLLASPVLRAVFVDEHGIPVADSPLVLRPPRMDEAALREALLRLASSTPGPHQPRHPDDHPPPDPGPPDPEPPDGGLPDPGPPDRGPHPIPVTTAPPSTPHRRTLADLLGPVPRWVADAAKAAVDAQRAAAAGCAPLPGATHPAGTPGAYRVPRRMARFLRARRPRCEWPGCGAAAIRCDLDHDRAWPDGPTCPCNVGPLCRRHHRVKQTGWGKQRTHDGVRWTSLNGKTWTSPSPHQPPQPAIRPLPTIPTRSPLHDLSPLELDDELWHLDPGSPIWDDPAAHELRADDTEPDETDGFPADTRWNLDLDDPYAWLGLPHPADA